MLYRTAIATAATLQKILSTSTQIRVKKWVDGWVDGIMNIPTVLTHSISYQNVQVCRLKGSTPEVVSWPGISFQ